MPTIMVVDDELSILKSIERLFIDDDSYEIVTTISPKQGLDILAKRKGQFDLVISDERMPEMSGSEFLALVREKQPTVMRILLTGYADQAATIRAINEAQVFRYVSKPWNSTELLAIVRDAIEIKTLKDRNEILGLKVLGQKNELEKMNAELEKTVALRTDQLRKSLEVLKQRNNQLGQQRQGTISLLRAILSTHDPIKARVAGRIDQAWQRLIEAFKTIPNEDAHAAAQLAAWILEPGSPYLQFLGSIEGFEATTQFLAMAMENLDGSGPKKIAADQIPLESRMVRLIHDHYSLNPGQETLSRQFIVGRCNSIYDASLVKVFYSLIPVEAVQTILPVAIANLLDGMRLGADVILSNGAMLLTNGTVLNEKVIAQLKRISPFLGQQVISIDAHTPAIQVGGDA